MKLFALQLCFLTSTVANDIIDETHPSAAVREVDDVTTASPPGTITALDRDAAVDSALQDISDLLLNRSVVIGLQELTKHLVDLTYADIIWNKYWNMKFWPSNPSEVKVDIQPVIRKRIPRGIVLQEQKELVYRTVTRCVNPSSEPIACEVPGYNYTIEQEIHMTGIEGLKQDEGIVLPVDVWIEALNHPYGWDWPLDEEDILLRGESMVNIQPDTVEIVPPHHTLRVETEVEKILVRGEAVVDVIIGNTKSDILEWTVTACAVPYESATMCRPHQIGPFTPQLISAQLSPTAKAALCIHRDVSQCLLTLGEDGKVHSKVRSRYAATPSSKIRRRVWLEEKGRTDYLLSVTEQVPAAHPPHEISAII